MEKASGETPIEVPSLEIPPLILLEIPPFDLGEEQDVYLGPVLVEEIGGATFWMTRLNTSVRFFYPGNGDFDYINILSPSTGEYVGFRIKGYGLDQLVSRLLEAEFPYSKTHVVPREASASFFYGNISEIENFLVPPDVDV